MVGKLEGQKFLSALAKDQNVQLPMTDKVERPTLQ